MTDNGALRASHADRDKVAEVLRVAAGDGRLSPEELDERLEVGSGRARRENRWVVPKRMDVKVSSGHVTLDFTQAVITKPVLRVDADVRSGHLTFITKPGIVVDADDVSVRSGRVKIHAPWGDAVPALLRIEVAVRVRSGHIAARPPHRTFWQWLRRAPRRYAIAA